MSNDEKPVRWVQSLNYTLHAREVGVMNVFEKDGALVARLSVFDPRTRKDDDVLVKANDEVVIGDQRYRVVDIVPTRGGERAWLDVQPVPMLH